MSRWEREGHGNHVFRAEIRHCFFLQDPFLQLKCFGIYLEISIFRSSNDSRSGDLNNLRRPMDMIYKCIYYE